MMVHYHGPSGEQQGVWPDGTRPSKVASCGGRTYDYAGVQDGAHHYRERAGG